MMFYICSASFNDGERRMSDPVDPTPPPAAPLAGRMDDRPEMAPQAIEKSRFAPGNGAPFASRWRASAAHLRSLPGAGARRFVLLRRRRIEQDVVEVFVELFGEAVDDRFGVGRKGGVGDEAELHLAGVGIDRHAHGDVAR